jgi:hypothetical protein
MSSEKKTEAEVSRLQSAGQQPEEKQSAGQQPEEKQSAGQQPATCQQK